MDALDRVLWKTLLEVQQLERDLQQKKAWWHAYEKGDLWAKEAQELLQEEERLKALKRQMEERERERKRLELERLSLEEDLKKLEKRAESGLLRSPKDYESYEKQKAALKQGIARKEEEELERMEWLEEAEKALSRGEKRVAQLASKVREVRAREEAKAPAIQEIIREGEARLAALKEAIPAEVWGEYRRLAPGLGGQPLAPMRKGRCTYCGVEQPVAVVQRVQRGLWQQCQHCGHVLVPEDV
ncbi:MAG: hypothetical protein KM310_05710 [Clostridiales bacterium]|nr:hypothetical protein [Clostridiales bacterium]